VASFIQFKEGTSEAMKSERLARKRI
jgi:hypothetical protein